MDPFSFYGLIKKIENVEICDQKTGKMLEKLNILWFNRNTIIFKNQKTTLGDRQKLILNFFRFQIQKIQIKKIQNKQNSIKD